MQLTSALRKALRRERLLADRYNTDFLRRSLIPLTQWHPFPPAEDRSAWAELLSSELNRERQSYLATEAASLYLLRHELHSLSPALVERTKQAVQDRVIGPVETRDDFWWLSGRNNWTPWCASNVLGAAMYLMESGDRLVSLTHKLMEATDRFIAGYGDDGCCDEGPGYW